MATYKYTAIKYSVYAVLSCIQKGQPLPYTSGSVGINCYLKWVLSKSCTPETCWDWLSCPHHTGPPLFSPVLLKDRLFQFKVQMFEMSLAPWTFSKFIQAALSLLVEAGMKCVCFCRHLCLATWNTVYGVHAGCLTATSSLWHIANIVTLETQMYLGYHISFSLLTADMILP